MTNLNQISIKNRRAKESNLIQFYFFKSFFIIDNLHSTYLYIINVYKFLILTFN